MAYEMKLKYFKARAKAMAQWRELHPENLDAQLVEIEVEAHPNTIAKFKDFARQIKGEWKIILIENQDMPEGRLGFGVRV